MQILLHADPNTDGSAPMTLHLQTVVKAALARFGDRVTRVEATCPTSTARPDQVATTSIARWRHASSANTPLS
jgi:hypothetical protein